MDTLNEASTWDVLESKLFASGAQLLAVVMQAAEARAAQTGTEVITQLLHNPDLAPRLVLAVAGANADELTMGVWLDNRITGEPVARIFEVVARGGQSPCHH